jgi:hypothetical protein
METYATDICYKINEIHKLSNMAWGKNQFLASTWKLPSHLEHARTVSD